MANSILNVFDNDPNTFVAYANGDPITAEDYNEISMVLDALEETGIQMVLGVYPYRTLKGSKTFTLSTTSGYFHTAATTGTTLFPGDTSWTMFGSTPCSSGVFIQASCRYVSSFSSLTGITLPQVEAIPYLSVTGSLRIYCYNPVCSEDGTPNTLPAGNYEVSLLALNLDDLSDVL
jgi:hypothetical protein